MKLERNSLTEEFMENLEKLVNNSNNQIKKLSPKNKDLLVSIRGSKRGFFNTEKKNNEEQYNCTV